ncbi:OmpA family protein, partial [Zavarzinia sp.]|uniref:OmpA family protein n=1 Tax=Zavarzinia sp. TaxID=2027920 RepID=UPI003BB5F380
IVADVYQQQLAETRSPRSVPVSMPQFEASRAPALPVTGVPMTAAMQAALGGAAPARVPVRLDMPQDSGRRAAAPARATTAAAAAGSASGSGTVIGFAAGSIDLSPAARESIRQMASALHSGAAQVRIVGYARAKGDGGDSVGAFGLSIDRANAVAAELMAAGVPAQAVMVEAIVADAGAASQRNRGKGPEAVVFVE